MDREKEFLDAIESLYRNMFMTVGCSSMNITDAALKYANKIYTEKYPDKWSEARKIEN